MSGKHDKSPDDDRPANLLLTGPIVIRGLGRSVKDAFLPGRPSRHRAFPGAEPEDAGEVEPTPLQQMLAGGPTVADPGPSSDLRDAGVAHTVREDGPEEDRMGDARDLQPDARGDAAGEPAAESPTDETPAEEVPADQRSAEEVAGDQSTVVPEDFGEPPAPEVEPGPESTPPGPPVDAIDDFFADGPRAAVSLRKPPTVRQPPEPTGPGEPSDSEGPPEHPAAEPAAPAPPPLPAKAVSATRAATPAARPSRPAPRRPRMRERFGREAVGIVVLVVLALVCAGLITAVVLKTQRDAAIAAQEAADYTPPLLATAAPLSTGPVVAVIGDGTTTRSASGVTAEDRWSALLGSALDTTIEPEAESGMGYAAKSAEGRTFGEAAADIPADAEVVVFFGGAEDADVSALSLAKAATDAYSAAQQQAPDATLIVVGPAIAAGVDDADLTEIRTVLRSAATIAKATWVDPIDEQWLPARVREAASPTALTAAAEKTLAAKMQAEVEKALD